MQLDKRTLRIACVYAQGSNNVVQTPNNKEYCTYIWTFHASIMSTSPVLVLFVRAPLPHPSAVFPSSAHMHSKTRQRGWIEPSRVAELPTRARVIPGKRDLHIATIPLGIYECKDSSTRPRVARSVVGLRKLRDYAQFLPKVRIQPYLGNRPYTLL